MFGRFDEQILSAYVKQVREKRVKGGQGTEYADNLGVGSNDHSFLDNEDNQEAQDYNEFSHYDFGACVRGGL